MKILHNVSVGDTVESIIAKYGCNPEEFMKINDLYGGNLTGRETIVIPHNKSDFAVVKNCNRDVLVEVAVHNREQLQKIVNESGAVASCAGALSVGDKVLVGKIKKTHIVRPLENLQLIAKKVGKTAENLIEINNLKTHKLFIGQKIYY